MRWVTYRSATDGAQRAGLIVDDEVYAMPVPVPLTDLLGDLAGAARQAQATPFEVIPLAQAQLCAPIPRPPSIRDFMAFEDHVVTSMKAIGSQVSPVWYQQPVFYFTNPAAVYGPGAQVPIAPGSTKYDYELEVAAVIGRAGSDLRPDTAEAHIAGYTILCDWSARDLQGVEMQVGLGPAKGKDTATSLGPWLVTPDELESTRDGNGFDLAMTADVNGRRYSAGSLRQLYWSFGELLAYASRGTTLMPGDVLGSGTVGTGCILELSRVHGIENYPWLAAGDTVRLDVERLGTLESTVVAGADVVPLR